MPEIALEIEDSHERCQCDRDSDDVYRYFQSVFKLVDTNKDGYISVRELKEFLDANEHANVPEKIVKVVYRKFDANKDQKLELDEFLDMLTDDDFKSAFGKVAQGILKFVAPSKTGPGRGHLILQRTITNTGMYEKQIKWNVYQLGLASIALLQVVLFYVNRSLITGTKDKGGLYDALKFDPCRKLQVYRYISYIFVHSSEVHLYGNVVVQVLIGVPLEMVHSWRMMVIYFGGGVAGAVMHSVCSRGVGLIGSSGAVYSFYTAHISAVIMNWREMINPAMHLLIFGIIVLFECVYKMLTSDSDHWRNVGYFSHLGGALTGLLLGVLVLRNLRETEREKLLWHACCVALGLLALVLVFLDVCLPTDCVVVEASNMSYS
ncbi:unnamed protein product [Phyllotreta striolata]|uniref:EF-hand domain-containing protein n=1 Tax=Phyllotreta striolata TaxID=444603 RepID=A0A9N9XR26_PHYSR|nr:unnamed protein product [Phyllotreta striolata]